MKNLSPEEVAKRWMEAYNRHDPEAAIALYDESVENTQLPWQKTVLGREAMRVTYVKVFQAFPDIHVEIENVIANEPWIAVEWRFSGTMKGEFSSNSST